MNRRLTTYKGWEKLLREYGEQYSLTYPRMPGTKPHPSESGYEEEE